jgi:hypothetical protein
MPRLFGRAGCEHYGGRPFVARGLQSNPISGYMEDDGAFPENMSWYITYLPVGGQLRRI